MYKINLLAPAAFLGIFILVCPVGHAAEPCPAPATGAFTGCYYSNVSLTGNPVLVRTDSQINFAWGKTSPDASLPPENFSVLWQGNFVFSPGIYTLNAITSDGMRIFLDGNLILDKWSDQHPTAYSVSQTLSGGTHLINVQYYEWMGTATAQLSWSNGATAPPVPVISSFAATPASVTPGQPVTLSWTVSGAAAISLDNGIGDVTGRTSVTVNPLSPATYTLTASNSAGTSTASAAVEVSPAPDTQPPTVPTLISATARSGGEVDLTWTASTDNIAVAGYQIVRNGSVIGAIPAASLSYADTTVGANTAYTYLVKAFDAAGNYSAASNSMGVTTPGAAPASGGCPAPATGSFTGCYYSNVALTGNPVMVRTDNQINFSWGKNSPDASLPPENFSVLWQGNFSFSPGVYTFTATMSDGMRIFFDGRLILDKWNDQRPATYAVSQTVSAGNHLVSVQYYEWTGTATAQFSWASGTTAPPVPVISFFTATPSGIAPGQPVTLSWTVSGATAISIDNGIGVVASASQTIVSPVITTTYNLTASNAQGSSKAAATVAVTIGPDTQPPTAPTLLSANAPSGAEVDLTWSASTDNVAVAGYQIIRNGAVVGTVAAPNLSYADFTVSSGTSYVYTVKAYDATLNYSVASNSLSVTTTAGPLVSVQWYGACWETLTLSGVTGSFQSIDFRLTTATPVPVQGTLFGGLTCDPAGGSDNMNDSNALTPSTHMIQGFSHHPGEMPTSAVFWVGPRTADGQCAAGVPCSGCVQYTTSTPSCDSLP